ncbi:MAG: redoxin domain-containing protein [Planctomycetes bacterium]|nr:redoxin domain-containing protein [Planctomycetota bacterium]
MSPPPALLAILSAVLVPSAPAPCSLAAADEKEPRGLEIGDRAPDFDLHGVDGKRRTLADFAAAKVLAVVFTCNHCPTAQAYEERVKKLHADFKDRGAALVAISPNDPEAVRLDELGYTDLSDSLEEMVIRAKHRGFEFPYLYDGERQAVSRAYGPRATPHVFVFDAERKLRYSGRIDDDESGKSVKSHDARNAIEAVLAGNPVPVERTRSFGCSIKWSDKREDNRRFLKKLAEEKVSLERIDAKAAKELREKGDKLRLINVWATWCGPCAAEMPELVETFRMYRHRSLEFVTISLDDLEKEAQVLEFLRKQQVSSKNYHYGRAHRDALADALEKSWTGALPFTLLVRPGGKVAFQKEGQVDPLELRRAIVDVLGRTY